MLRTCRLGALVMALLAMPLFAQQTTFIFDLDASQVAGGSASTATGKAFLTVDSLNLINITVHHDVPNASLLTIEVGGVGVTGTTYNLFGITSNPAQASMTLSSPADFATMLADGFYIQIYAAGATTPDIRGQITNPVTGQVFISEWCNDPVPPSLSIGIDTNLDGVLATSSNQSDDEFVEIVNGTDAPVMLDGWTFSDAVTLRHTFPAGTTLQPGEAISLFGGGNLQNFLNFGLQAQAATTFSLGLNNGGDTMTLADSLGTVIDQIVYVSQGPGDSDGESVVKIPETPQGVPQPSSAQPFNPTSSAGRRSSNKYPWSTMALPIATYPGNGTDAAIEVSINGVLDNQPTNQHNIQGGDIIQLRYHSPGFSLDGFPFLAVAQPYLTGFPAPVSGFIGDPFPTIVYSGALPTFVLADGITNGFILPFQPVLGYFVHSGYIPLSAAGTNTSYMILLITFDPGINAQDLGNAEAHELIVQ